MAPDLTFSSLPLPFQQLIRLMQSMRHGRLLHLAIRDGLPVLDPPPTFVRTLKLDRPPSANEPGVTTSPEFPLRQEVVNLVLELRGVKEGTVERLEVMNGLPVLAELAEPLARPWRRPDTTSTRTPTH